LKTFFLLLRLSLPLEVTIGRKEDTFQNMNNFELLPQILDLNVVKPILLHLLPPLGDGDQFLPLPLLLPLPQSLLVDPILPQTRNPSRNLSSLLPADESVIVPSLQVLALSPPLTPQLLLPKA